MRTAIDLCNVSLGYLGQPPIASLSESSRAAVLCSQNFEAALDEVLRSHPWNFAIKRVVLSPDSEAPAFGFTARFLKPGDWLRTLGEEEDIPMKSEGRYLLSDAAVLYLSYLSRVTDLTLWDSLALQCLARLISHKIAYSLTGSTSLSNDQFTLYSDLIQSARNIDAQEDEAPQMIDASTLRTARY